MDAASGLRVGTALVQHAVIVVAASNRVQIDVEELELDEVVRLLGLLQAVLRVATPAIRLWPQVGQAVHRQAEEGGHILREVLGSHPVHQRVPFVLPRYTPPLFTWQKRK
jgi:hypothetical protein